MYDSEWIKKRPIVESRLRHLVGRPETKIGARQCRVVELEASVARDFFERTHLQGSCGARHAYGLVGVDGDIWACMSFGVPRYSTHYQYELLRYSTKLDAAVIGGAGKLFSHFVNSHEPSSVASYCDLRTGTGSLYSQLGFTLDGVTQPNYWYFHTNKWSSTYQLFHRSNFQKHKLEKKLETFDPSLTEWENMQANGYDRIWDVGNARYVWRP